jgi:hypothetical protein
MENDQPQPVPQPDARELQAQVDSLQRMVIATLLLVLVVSGTLLIFFWRQLHNTNVDLEAMRPAWTNTMVQFQRNSPIIDDTVKKFQDFARSNSDFGPVLAKYGLKPGSGTSPLATPPAKKK